jgi:tryptophan 2,3-dioxygenase
LNPASGFQSMQFREIEFSSGLKDQSVLRESESDEFAHGRLQARMQAPSLGDTFYALLRRRGFDAPADDTPRDEKERRRPYGKRVRAVRDILSDFEKYEEEFALAEALLEHDEWFSLWRSHHIKMVERMVGAKRGTGGSEGIGYLRTTLDKRFFPELWEARTYLSANKGELGCPFVGQEGTEQGERSSPHEGK